MALLEPAVTPIRIPFEGTTLPAYFIPAHGRANEVRPLIILTNGYDATITDMYFASAVAATQRGYHCLLFDGPGQGELLYEHDVPLRPDWETVIRPIVDHALGIATVDPACIAISGWSLGGYLAPRAASGEPRLAACIADPGLWSLADAFRAFAKKVGEAPDQVADLTNLDQALVERLWHIIQNDEKLNWSVVKRGFWVNGASDLRHYLQLISEFSMDGRATLIRAPTLLTLAEGDPLAVGTPDFYEKLCCPKELICFSVAEGAGDHCEMMNRSLLNQRVLDWLDAIFDVKLAS